MRNPVADSARRLAWSLTTELVSSLLESGSHAAAARAAPAAPSTPDVERLACAQERVVSRAIERLRVAFGEIAEGQPDDPEVGLAFVVSVHRLRGETWLAPRRVGVVQG